MRGRFIVDMYPHGKSEDLSCLYIYVRDHTAEDIHDAFEVDPNYDVILHVGKDREVLGVEILLPSERQVIYPESSEDV